MFRSAAAILRKDLAIEVRTKQSVPAMALFSISAFVLFHFGLDRDRLDGELASGTFWVTALLASVLAVNRLFASEREQGGLDGLLLAPIDRTAIFLAKATALFLYLVVLDLIAIPAFAILLLGPSAIDCLPALIATLLLAERRPRDGRIAGRRARRRGPRARPPGAAPAAPAAHAGADRRGESNTRPCGPYTHIRGTSPNGQGSSASTI